LFDELDKTENMEEGLSAASQYGVDLLPPGAVEGS